METGEPPHIIILLISLAFLFLLSMFFSSAETAYVSLNTLKLRFLQEQKHPAALRAEKILRNKQKFLSTILIGNSIVNIAISAVLTAAALAMFGSSGLALAVGTGTFLVLIFGEIVPKSVALVYSDALSLHFARLILFFMALFAPAVWIFSSVTGFMLRLCGIQAMEKKAAVTEDDLKEFFAAGEETGRIGIEERQLLNKILHYGDSSAKAVMTPRLHITAIQRDASLPDILELAQKTRFSRFPVYTSGIDSIIGIFYLKDFLCSPAYQKRDGNFKVEDYMQKPLFIFETTKLADIEKKLHDEKKNMAIVLDEYGGTSGLVTAEDLREEIFGSILDEYDGDEKKAVTPVFQTGTVPMTVTIPGAMRLIDVNEQFGVQAESRYSDTIGGYMMEEAGEIPECGFSLLIGTCTFIVRAMDGKRITDIEVIP